ncbi:MAG: PQQ-binding-like beta-propeller repeat protein [Kiritimatiellia bacterium]|nr:PQQ-binding-like beta-propeller repeat protein [Kiritimatiellia bacterium]MDP6809577.1 PQQ-binding-like beta-propeller repeat protein [Kiritimatiellia bacterium]MDP7023572.1 PQQ-binding-like beta-propeller repeat protein [Kiritimatiellia bacterium]
MSADRTASWRETAAWVVLGVAGVFCATLLVLMLASVVQMRNAPPLDTPELQALRELVRQQPEHEGLQAQVQALDLLARRAHFAGGNALRVGSGMLLAGLAVVLGAAHVLRESRVGVHAPAKADDAAAADTTHASRRALLGVLGVIVLLALLIPLLRNGPPGGRALPGTEMSGTSGGARPPGGPDSAPSTPCLWPNFRGPGGLGVAVDVDPPLGWDGTTGSNILWRTEVPRVGFSSPIVCGNRVFLSGGDATLREVYCFDADDGSLQWRHPVTGIAGSSDKLPDVTDDTGYAAPTMAGAGGRVFALFATGDVVALDHAGERLWARFLGQPDNPYGHASSLIVFEDLLLIQLDDNRGGRLEALNVADGTTAWQVERDVEGPCWSSPVLMQTARGPELILNGNPSIAGYDPRSGALRWSDECMSGEVAVSAATTDDIIFIANEYAVLVALRVTDGPERLWEYDEDLPDVASPVAGAGCLFVPTSYGLLTCFDAATGSQHWSHEFDEGFYASPVLAAGRIYLVDMEGVMHVIKAGTTFELLASNPLGERATSTSAFVGDRIYIRGAKHLVCIGAARE